MKEFSVKYLRSCLFVLLVSLWVYPGETLAQQAVTTPIVQAGSSATGEGHSSSSGSSPALPTSNSSTPGLSSAQDNKISSSTALESTSSDSKAVDSNLQWNGSILFSESEISRLRRIMDSMTKPGDIFSDIDQPDGEVPEEKEVNYESYYLASIIYNSPDDWIIWLNGRKITPLIPSPDEKITIKHVERTKVDVILHPKEYSKLRSAWDTINTGDVKKTKNISVVLDDDAGNVGFTLRPNQSFYVSSFQIVEGRSPPREIPVVDTGVSSSKENKDSHALLPDKMKEPTTSPTSTSSSVVPHTTQSGDGTSRGAAPLTGELPPKNSSSTEEAIKNFNNAPPSLSASPSPPTPPQISKTQ